MEEHMEEYVGSDDISPEVRQLLQDNADSAIVTDIEFEPHPMEVVAAQIWADDAYQHVRELARLISSHPASEIHDDDIAEVARMEFFTKYLRDYILPNFGYVDETLMHAWGLIGVLLGYVKGEEVGSV